MTSLSFSPRSFSFFFFIYQQSPPDLILFISERRSLSFNIFKLGKVHNKWFRSIFLPTTCTPISSVYRECQVVWPQMIESGPHLNIFLSLSLFTESRTKKCMCSAIVGKDLARSSQGSEYRYSYIISLAFGYIIKYLTFGHAICVEHPTLTHAYPILCKFFN